jgi:hypothetical protein
MESRGHYSKAGNEDSGSKAEYFLPMDKRIGVQPVSQKVHLMEHPDLASIFVSKIPKWFIKYMSKKCGHFETHGTLLG